MPQSTSSKSSMSLGELAVCEEVLDRHREYALDLSSNIEKVRQWHCAEGCSETLQDGVCTICELCSANGLMGSTKKALTSYEEAEKHLQEVRASFGQHVRRRRPLDRETLFTSSLAKAIFVCVVAAGDTLRSQRATWQARIQKEAATFSPTQSPQRSDAGILDKNSHEDVLIPAYTDPSVTGPETMPNSSMFLVFKQCSSNDCPCGTNGESATSKGACGSPEVTSKVPLSPSRSKKTHTYKGAVSVSEAAIKECGNRAALSMTTDLRCRSSGTSDMSTAPTKVRTNAQTREQRTHHNLDDPDAQVFNIPGAQDVTATPGEREPSARPSSDSVRATQETESLSPRDTALIVGPKILCLRAQIARSDDTHRALMAWCRAWMAALQSDPSERHETGPENSLTHASPIMKGRRYPTASALDLELVEIGKSLCNMSSRVTEVASHDSNIEMTTQDLQFNSEQEELKRSWLAARQRRYKDPKKRSALV